MIRCSPINSTFYIDAPSYRFNIIAPQEILTRARCKSGGFQHVAAAPDGRNNRVVFLMRNPHRATSAD
jgi:hypothetical protein